MMKPSWRWRGVLLAGPALAAAPAALQETAWELLVVAQVDVVVVGGSSAACAAAAAKSGAKVFLLAPRTYLGDDLAGRLRLWLDAPGAAQGGGPLRCYPSDLVTGSDGKLGGVVMANRAGRG